MARVLILEPEPDLRRLAQEAVAELGHEALVCDRTADFTDADVLLSAEFAGADEVIARLRGNHPSLPLVLVGTMPGSTQARALRPDRYLLRPYKLWELEQALQVAGEGA